MVADDPLDRVVEALHESLEEILRRAGHDGELTGGFASEPDDQEGDKSADEDRV